VYGPRLTRTATGLLLCSLAAAGCGSGSRTHRASSLRIVSAATPRFPLAGFQTFGSYPHVRGHTDLRLVNTALRRAVVADEQAFVPYVRSPRARRASRSDISTYRGQYVTDFARRYVSASSVVVSAMLPRTRSILPMQPGADGWLSITVAVPSGKRVALVDLFANRTRAFRVLTSELRKTHAEGACLHASPTAFRAAVEGYGTFALAPDGLALGLTGDGWCYRAATVVPYRRLGPELSALGTRLVAGVRRPSFRADAKHLTYCRAPDLSWSQLAATGDVACKTARKVEATVFSRACASKNRCAVSAFTCLALWDGRYDRPFEYTHHAICHRGRARIVIDEG
jgi:hypothetical protein